MRQFGAAEPVTCPACGVGAAAGSCTLTRGAVVTLSCSTCGLRIRNGVVLEHGVDIDPDEVRELAERHAPWASHQERYVAPEARPLLLVPTDAVEVPTPGPAWPPIASLTVRFARPRPTKATRR